MTVSGILISIGSFLILLPLILKEPTLKIKLARNPTVILGSIFLGLVVVGLGLAFR